MDAELTRLAAAHGIETRYWDWLGNETTVSHDTVVAVLSALDIDASTSHSVRTALDRVESEAFTTLLPPVAVVATMRGPAVIRIRVPGDHVPRAWLELGTTGEVIGLTPAASHVRHPAEPANHTGRDTGRALTEYEFPVPSEVPFGWHRLHARLGPHHEEAALLVHPGRLRECAQRSWGFMTQLYSARSTGSRGFGDLRDLADLAGWSGTELGAGFVLVNPLHAAEPFPPISPSPYLPMSRRYTSPLYLRLEDVPGYGSLPAGDRERAAEQERAAAGSARAVGQGQMAGQAWQAKQARPVGRDDLIDRDTVWEAKRSLLEALHRAPVPPVLREAYEAYRRREGRSLTDFATWCAIAEEYGSDWRHWPAGLRDPNGADVPAAQLRLADRIDFYTWLQWLLDEQLAGAQSTAKAAGMPIGIVHDLAVGVHPGGADAWMYHRYFAPGMSVGAPPDEFNQIGQDWGQPPWHPTRLAAGEYLPYRELLGNTLRHAGGLRLDHVMQVSRLWWVPEGAPPDQGAYVRYDRSTILGVLCWEAERSGAILIGEDLGTVEPDVRRDLAECGILGTSVLWFERDEHGAPRPPEHWRAACLATVGTHDMPPVGGYAHGDHIELRERLGLLTRPAEVEWSEHRRRMADWIGSLERLGLLAPGLTPETAPDAPAFVAALHAFLVRTEARLVGVSLADAVGERHTQNQPGTVDEYPNWRIPLTDGQGRPVLLDRLPGDPMIKETLGPILDALGRAGPAGPESSTAP